MSFTAFAAASPSARAKRNSVGNHQLSGDVRDRLRHPRCSDNRHRYHGRVDLWSDRGDHDQRINLYERHALGWRYERGDHGHL